MLPKSNANTMVHWWRHSVFSVGDIKKVLYLKMISMIFATFLSLFQLICIIFGYFIVIWSPRLETEFRRIFEKCLDSNGLKVNLKFTFLWKTWSKRTFRPTSLLKTSDLRKNWILKILFNPLVPRVAQKQRKYHVSLMTS